MKDGILRAIFSGPCEGLGAKYAEFQAIKVAMELFIEADWVGKSPLVIESDAKMVLNWISNKFVRLWGWWTILVEIDKLVSKIAKVHFNYVSRQTNVLADYLVKDDMRRKSIFRAWC
ncbi:hypothetical protein V6N12_069524 [Hibiscus sabdariffa]|uniref:RNase H type-1 domain-containing protein n=1 Tax=Hibiscus sabdariffa TaxID=183260 RepID=A0ABR2FEA0_9ROSI